MVTNDFVRGAPPREGMAKNLEQSREILPLKASSPDDGPTIAIKDHHAIEPLSVNLDQIAQVDKPHLMRGDGL